MADVVLGPWKVGIDNVSPPVNLPRDERGRRVAVVDAVNGDFDREGNFSRRGARDSILSQTGLHSLWTSSTGVSLCMRGAQLCRAEYGADALTLTAIATLPSTDRVSYDELNGEILFGNNGSLGLLDSFLTPRSVGILTPPAPQALPSSTGGLFAGRYGVAITFLRGTEESALSEVSFVDVPENGGISLSALSSNVPSDVTFIRIYRTNHNGDVLYRIADAPAATSTYAIGTGPMGRAADTQYLDRMLRGSIVRAWRGHLLVVRNNVMAFSDSMRYGLYSPRHGFIQEPKRILLAQPVEGGVFVGTSEGVFFYSGTSPKDWNRVRTGGKPPIQGTGTRIDASEMGGDIGASGGYVAMWLAENGFVVGTADGTLVQPQASRLKLDPAGIGAMVVHDRRAVASVI